MRKIAAFLILILGFCTVFQGVGLCQNSMQANKSAISNHQRPVLGHNNTPSKHPIQNRPSTNRPPMKRPHTSLVYPAYPARPARPAYVYPTVPANPPRRRVNHVRKYLNTYQPYVSSYYYSCSSYAYDPYVYNYCLMYGPLYCQRAGFNAVINISL